VPLCRKVNRIGPHTYPEPAKPMRRLN